MLLYSVYNFFVGGNRATSSRFGMENYYRQLVEITRDYLGPAAERFVNRQIEFHLEKRPDALTREDVVSLSKWISAALTVLTRDQIIVDEASRRIKSLAE